MGNGWTFDMETNPFRILFKLQMEHGFCLALTIPSSAGESDPDRLDKYRGHLHPGEFSFAATLPPRRASTWIAGRLAIREAMRCIGETGESPVMSYPRGAPVLPPGISGSISHKTDPDLVTAAALVAARDHQAIGVDIEFADRLRGQIGTAVLTGEEILQIDSLPPDKRSFETLMRFSIKEAVYKAIDPFLHRYVDYKEISVFPDDDGKVKIQWHPAPPASPGKIEARWRVRDGLIITTAKAEANSK